MFTTRIALSSTIIAFDLFVKEQYYHTDILIEFHILGWSFGCLNSQTELQGVLNIQTIREPTESWSSGKLSVEQGKGR